MVATPWKRQTVTGQGRSQPYLTADADAGSDEPIPSAKAVTDQFETNGGLHPGLHRNHAKGMCVSSHFDSNDALASYSAAEVFTAGMRTPVVARFSLPGPNPEAKAAATPVRGLGLAFNLPDGEEWHTAMLDAPAFASATPSRILRQPARQTHHLTRKAFYH